MILGRGCVTDEGGRHAWWWALFLTRMSDNHLGPEGAQALSEPLGKLTALQQLDLSSKILICRFLIILILGRGCVADEGGRHAWWWALFLTRISDNGFGREGAQALSEPLGKLTALQKLYLRGKILICRFF